MLNNSPVQTTIPVVDIERARSFYVEQLGLRVVNELMPGMLLLRAGEGTFIMLFQRSQTTADHSVAAFTVDNIEEMVRELSSNGVHFEQYDMGNGMRTNDLGILTMGQGKAAWFKDTEGNVLSIVNRV